ncbi:MAG: hypothetical protein KF710_04950 [Rhodocyclaceae bacterium]|nr:hypothetical protein [Rhodocyclaceae bacterium]MCB1900086.1 hypothetical protein [Rhodocyclaceae bacterium]
MGVDDQAKTAECQKKRSRGTFFAIQSSASVPQAEKRQRGKDAGGNARCIMYGKHDAQGLGQQGCNPVIERAKVRKDGTTDAWIQGASAAEHFKDWAQMCRIGSSPRVVADDAGKEIDSGEKGDRKK